MNVTQPPQIVVESEIPFFQRRLTINLMMLLGATLMITSFFLPYWEMHLTAPQYPDGLHVYTYLNGVKGDTVEINQLNHYIGMGKIDDAAPFERSIAWFAILGLGLGGLVVTTMNFKIKRIFYLPPIIFIVGFLVDFIYWMHHFGHNLDPKAPLNLSIEPFMPVIMGTGKIGQFTSTSYLSTGFWLAVVSCIIFTFTLVTRRAKCLKCEHRHRCKVLCDMKRND